AFTSAGCFPYPGVDAPRSAPVPRSCLSRLHGARREGATGSVPTYGNTSGAGNIDETTKTWPALARRRAARRFLRQNARGLLLPPGRRDAGGSVDSDSIWHSDVHTSGRGLQRSLSLIPARGCFILYAASLAAVSLPLHRLAGAS